MPDIDFRLLRQCHLLAEVIDAGSLSRASRKVGLTLPALTEQIRQLEAELGVALLYRTPRGTTPTEKCIELMREILDFTRAAGEFTERVRVICSSASERLRVGAVYESTLSLIPQLRAELTAAHPGLGLRVIDIDSSDAEEALIENRIDLAIGHFEKFTDERIRSRALMDECPVLVVPAGHPFARLEEVSIADTAAEPWVVIDRTTSRYYCRRLEAFLRRHAIRPNITQTAESISIEIGLVGAGEGIALAPESFLAVLPPTVRAVRVKEAGAILTLSAAWMTERSSESLGRTLDTLWRVCDAKKSVH
ncbi:LysR family transcriptional regulator [Sutterella sp.]|uniref:LysR family transcriptional regulator n=1 Tax=Sutterella sp. TaxID=1981025 RepID=UPI0026E05C45|nr:LysR family transcriptional regulator [Sutterella sp.]MDO5532364.1 LysR family transcriptional regulator [Sutterella sp.]